MRFVDVNKKLDLIAQNPLNAGIDSILCESPEGVWNRVLRRIFGSSRKEVVGGWRRLHNEELHNLYASRNIMTVTK